MSSANKPQQKEEKPTTETISAKAASNDTTPKRSQHESAQPKTPNSAVEKNTTATSAPRKIEQMSEKPTTATTLKNTSLQDTTTIKTIDYDKVSFPSLRITLCRN